MAEEAVKNGDATNENSKAVTFSALKPMLFVEAPKANVAVMFYKAAFGAEEVIRVSQQADQELPLVVCEEIKLAGKTLVVYDTSALVKSGVERVFILETEDFDAAVEQAVKAGAVKEGEVAEAVKAGAVKDPYGNLWMICSPAVKNGAYLNINRPCKMHADTKGTDSADVTQLLQGDAPPVPTAARHPGYKD